MADTARGPVVGRPLAFANEERRAVHSWSRISSAGHNVLLDALKILSPMSRDLSSSEDLVTFLQDLSEEGHKPTVLRSKDVYGYRSCTNQPLTEDKLKPPNRTVRPTAKRRGRRPIAKKREQQHPPTLSGIPLQPSQNGGGASTKAVALFSQKSLSCPLRLDGALIGDSAPVFYANGRAFPETHTELTSNGWKSNGFHRDGRGPKELNNPTRQRNGWKDKNSFRWKVIKVDDSRSVAEARRKAQKILQVNLSPVIQIQPLNHVLRDFRYQNK
ncbi:Coiled-coil domain-containing protein 71 [Nibea albiflora]|uniref:Coiled-coil domain-containing protein 71 n=1 Tax=Nibea albiflora TaxID=240163 RepID=A0ACB7F0K5_NIBAL|nr:Coiled-coil domain-containing protein 71 [Nibea albiflora]